MPSTYNAPLSKWGNAAYNFTPGVKPPEDPGEAALGLGAYQAEADRLGEVENQRWGEGKQVLGLAWKNAQRPAFTDQMVRRQFGNSAEQAAMSRNRAMASLRGGLGLSGQTTGSGAAMAAGAQIQSQQLGTLQASRRELLDKQATTNANQRMQLLGLAPQVADYYSRPPAILGLDARGDNIGAKLTLQQIQAQKEQAKQTSRDNRQSGVLGLAGSIAGGLIGLL